MRMMKNNNNETVMVIGIDHGYGNMKTATRCFPSGVVRYDKEPIFQNNLLVYNGMYYQINPDHHNCFIIVVFHHSHNHTSHFLNFYFFTFSQIREKPIFVSAKTLIPEKGHLGQNKQKEMLPEQEK